MRKHQAAELIEQLSAEKLKMLIAKGDYDRVLQGYTKAIQLNPDDAIAYNSRGGVYYLKEEYESAIVDFTKAIDLNPNYAEAYNNRGVAYHLKEEYESAIADYTQGDRTQTRLCRRL